MWQKQTIKELGNETRDGSWVDGWPDGRNMVHEPRVLMAAFERGNDKACFFGMVIDRLRLPHEEGNVRNVKVNKVFGFYARSIEEKTISARLRDDRRCERRTVRDITAKVLPNDNMPSRSEFLVKLLFYLSGDILLYRVFLQSSQRDLHACPLHVLRHVDVLDHCFLGRDVARCAMMG